MPTPATPPSSPILRENGRSRHGNILQVKEPNPAGGADYVTTYAHDMLNHLTQVSMTRGSTTQTRTFNYGSPPGRNLLSETHSESGTTSYTYNLDYTVAMKTDAKGQKAASTYDTYQRVTNIQCYPNGTTEDTCQRTNYAQIRQNVLDAVEVNVTLAGYVKADIISWSDAYARKLFASQSLISRGYLWGQGFLHGDCR